MLLYAHYCATIILGMFSFKLKTGVGIGIILLLCFFALCRNPLSRVPPVSKTHALKADSILAFAQTFLGTPYRAAGISPKTGFDCSGYTMFVFQQFGVKIPHSSVEQMKEGVEIDLCAAQKGDIVIFTGTNKYDRYPGHVGIVLKNDTCIVSFIHSSSNGGVKISTVERSYEERFLAVRRLNY